MDQADLQCMYWDEQCQRLRAALVPFDKLRTVRMSCGTRGSGRSDFAFAATGARG